MEAVINKSFLLFDHCISSITKEKKVDYYLIEKESLFVKLNYRIKLQNNQSRKVNIFSDEPLDNKLIRYNQNIIFCIDEIVTFWCKIGQKEIFYLREKKTTFELIKYWLYHTFFPILLTFENKYYFLHAGAIEIENKPILFIADSFGGKSTITDFFIKKGHVMVSDDKVATYDKDGKIYSVPSYPYHRPYRKVEDLGIFTESFASENRPIDSIFNLVKSNPNCEIKITKIQGVEKFKALRYATDIDLQIYEEQRFKTLSNLSNKVQVYNITIPWDLDRLEDVYNSIVNFIKNKKVNK